MKYLSEELMKRASVVTPNIAEAALLSGLEIKDLAGMEAAARKLVERGARAVVVKGGHMEKAVDVLFDGVEMTVLGGDHVKIRKHARLRMHVRFGDRRATRLRPPAARSRDAGKGLRHQGHRKRIRIGKGPGPLDHFYRTHHEPPLRGIHEVPQHGMHPASEPGMR